MKQLLTILALFSFFVCHAEPIKFEFYKGTVGKNEVVLYLGKGEGCGGDDYYYTSMYSYDNGKNWLLLEVTHNKKGFYNMVEWNFTGALMLTETAQVLNGIWYSPDRKKSLDVKLNKQTVSDKKLNELYGIWEKLNYERNDC